MRAKPPSAIPTPWSLVVFTTMSTIATGAWIVAATLNVVGSYPAAGQDASLFIMAVAWVCLVVGFCASVLHLGSPLRAFAAFHRTGSANLSNEVFSGFLFVVTSGLYLLVCYLGVLDDGVEVALSLLSSVMGLLFCFMSCRAYRTPTVPAWNSLAFSLGFAADAVLGGFCLVCCCASAFGRYQGFLQGALVGVALAAFAVSCMLTVWQASVATSKVNDWNDSEAKASTWRRLNCAKMLFQGLGVSTMAVAVIFDLGVTIWVLGIVLVAAGVFVERWSFYEAYDGVGLPK